MQSEVICVRCPKGCKVKVVFEGGSLTGVEGYGCLLGREYAVQEVVNPQRIVSTTVRVLKAAYQRLPVRTSRPVPKDKVREVVKALAGVTVEAPVKRGEVIVKNVAGTSVDVIAERDLESEGG